MSIQRESALSRLARTARLLARLSALLLVAGTAGAQTRAIVHRTALEYPVLAEKMRITGTVTVVAQVDAEGNVIMAKAIAGHAMLRPSAEKAVLQWKFASGPKPEETNIKVEFQLHGEGTR